jgi:hypothetical protein
MYYKACHLPGSWTSQPRVASLSPRSSSMCQGLYQSDFQLPPAFRGLGRLRSALGTKSSLHSPWLKATLRLASLGRRSRSQPPTFGS